MLVSLRRGPFPKDWVIGPGISHILPRKESGLGFTPPLRFSESRVKKGVVFLLMRRHFGSRRPVCVVDNTHLFFLRLSVSWVRQCQRWGEFLEISENVGYLSRFFLYLSL